MNDHLIIIPTYNEAENIVNLLEAIFSLPQDFAVLVVDDQSPDGTAALVTRLQKKYPTLLFLENRKQKEGLGRAYLHGFQWALERSYEYIFQMDADFSHHPNSLDNFCKAFIQGADVIIGSRYSNGVTVVNWPLNRILLSYAASKYVQLITGIPVKDPTAGYVGYRRQVLETLDLHRIGYVGYAFQIEMKYKAWKKGFRLVEIPIIFRNRIHGQSKMSGAIIWEALFGVLFLPFKKV
ncbi:MAG: polyprenol monophosphomannose synthase [Flavobacteriaceae bacterium]